MTVEVRKTKAQAEDQKNVARDVAEIVEPAAAIAFKEFRARDLAIATIEHAEDLIEHETPEERPVSSL